MQHRQYSLLREWIRSMWMPTLLALGMTLLQPYATQAADDWVVDGEHGQVHVHGALTEGACRLDMVSAMQDVALGETPTGRLNRVGEQGTPIAFHLQLRDCLRTQGAARDSRTGNLSWSASQPVATVAFLAPADEDTPALLKVRGVSGMGLRITDAAHQDIRLGDRSRAVFLTPGDDMLTYYVTPERTRAPLYPGAYRATVDFRLNYD